MNKVTIAFALLGLTVGGVGIGAGIAAVMMGGITNVRLSPYNPLKSTNAIELSDTPSNNLSASTGSTGRSCRLNSQVAVKLAFNKSLDNVGTVVNPFPVLITNQGVIGSEFSSILAGFSLVSSFKISDRARSASVPIVMYHDITQSKQVDWDVTPEELEEHFKAIAANGSTPISMDELVNHLRTGKTLPKNPILLTFDDNYLGQYNYAFPLLKKYNYPAVWSVHTRYVGVNDAKPKATWEQLREMQRSGLITIASHTLNHLNLQKLDESKEYSKIDRELIESKQVIEKELGVKVRYFTYPEGAYSDRVKEKVKQAGYEAALAMSLDPAEELPAQKSEDLLAIRRYGQSRFNDAIAIANNGQNEVAAVDPSDNLPDSRDVNFTTAIAKKQVTFDNIPITLISGGRPVTVHHYTRAPVQEIMQIPKAIAAVDGGFFSLESLESNKMIGPVLSQFSTEAGKLNIGRKGENPLLKNRPLVLISPTNIKFVPYDPIRYTSKEQLQAELPDVTDAFVAAGWLVKNGQPQNAASFGKLYGFDAHRDRAFWGIDRKGRPVVGVTMEMIDSVGLGKILAQAGLQEAVMLDSGASAALAYQGKSLMSYEPRPVPHIVALLNPDTNTISKWGGAVTCVVNNIKAKP